MTEIAKAIPGRMTKFKLTELSGVTRGAQAAAKVSFMKVAGEEIEAGEDVDPIIKRAFTADKRKALASSGDALPDGSFPIETKDDLANAVAAFGRAKDKDAAKRHIITRAKALGAADTLPESWSVKKAGDPAGLNIEGAAMSVAIRKALGLADTATDIEVEAAVAKLAGDGKDAPAKLAKAEARAGYLALVAKARPKDKDQMKSDSEMDDGDGDEPESPKVKKSIEFLKLSEAERDALIAKASAGDEVLVIGTATIRKSAVGEGVFLVMKQQQEINASNAQRIAKQEEDAALATFTKRAETDYPHLAGSVADRAAVLKHMSTAPEPVRKAADAILKAAEATSKLAFTKLGHGQGDVDLGDSATAEAKLSKLAKAKAEASNGKLSFAKAYSAVMEENPALYQEYLDGVGK